MDLESILRRRRKDLVVAAKATVDRGGRSPKPSQLSRLIAVCGEATCTEEIENYLRYQGSRDNQPWDPRFVESVISGVQASLLSLDAEKLTGTDRDRLRTAAWRTYAVFLARAYTFARASEARR